MRVPVVRLGRIVGHIHASKKNIFLGHRSCTQPAHGSIAPLPVPRVSANRTNNGTEERPKRSEQQERDRVNPPKDNKQSRKIDGGVLDRLSDGWKRRHRTDYQKIRIASFPKLETPKDAFQTKGSLRRLRARHCSQNGRGEQ